MQPKKVLHIVSVSFSLKYFVGNQFLYFKERGYNFTAACSPSAEFVDYSKKMKFSTFPVNISRSISPVQDIFSIYKLYRFIKREKFDIVIAHSPKGGLIGMIASFLAQTPRRIFFRHGLVFETLSGSKKQLMIFVEKIIGFCSHKVVNVSNSVQKKVEQFKLNSTSKNLILGKGSCNGVNTSLFRYSLKSDFHNNIVVGFIGRLSVDKGINELIGSLDFLEQYENLLLLLVGPLDERDGLSTDAIFKINNHPKIKYIGAVSNTSYYYNQMDIFILPSYREGFPTVNLEASSSELPIITSRKTGCIDSIIEHSTGIFTDITPEEIAKSISYYIENKNLRRLHGKNGREFVEKNFSEDVIYKDIELKVLNYKNL